MLSWNGRHYQTWNGSFPNPVQPKFPLGILTHHVLLVPWDMLINAQSLFNKMDELHPWKNLTSCLSMRPVSILWLHSYFWVFISFLIHISYFYIIQESNGSYDDAVQRRNFENSWNHSLKIPTDHTSLIFGNLIPALHFWWTLTVTSWTMHQNLKLSS